MTTPTPAAMKQFKIEDLSPTQLYVLRWLSKTSTSVQIAGYGRAKYLSASAALVRKRLAFTFRTGHYSLTDEGRKLAQQLPPKQPLSALEKVR